MAATRPFPALSSGDMPHHNRDMVLQKYLLLQEQHESLLEHLDQLRPLQTGGTVTTTTTSPAASPTQASFAFSHAFQSPQHHSRSSSVSQPYGQQRRASLPQYSAPRMHGKGGMDAAMDQNMQAELALEEAKLCDVNEGIKRALTELLNCEAVREDRAFRTWVQCRLMDTEKELRHGRRRRSFPID